jgi:hypothetical protein
MSQLWATIWQNPESTIQLGSTVSGFSGTLLSLRRHLGRGPVRLRLRRARVRKTTLWGRPGSLRPRSSWGSRGLWSSPLRSSLCRWLRRCWHRSLWSWIWRSLRKTPRCLWGTLWRRRLWRIPWCFRPWSPGRVWAWSLWRICSGQLPGVNVIKLFSSVADNDA